MHNTLRKWLSELEDETEIVTSMEINDEAHGNMVTFGFNAEMLQDWGKESLIEFLRSCASLYKRKRGESAMVFYAWLDEQAGNFRISAVSQTHEKLPFGCKLKDSSLESVVDGIYAGDSGSYANGALNVWQKNI